MKTLWQEFRHFLARGNVVDLAVGVIMGAAFGKIVTDLVEGIVMPPMGLIIGKIDFSSMFYVLDYSKGTPASLGDAKAKAIPVIAYGQFINDILTFVIVAAAVFLMVKEVNKIKGAIEEFPPSVAHTTKECPFCAMSISMKATRCPNCTSQLPASGPSSPSPQP